MTFVIYVYKHNLKQLVIFYYFLYLAEPVPSAAFQEELGQLVNEMTTKVLIGRPENIHLFLAEYLEDKMKRERQKGT